MGCAQSTETKEEHQEKNKVPVVAAKPAPPPEPLKQREPSAKSEASPQFSTQVAPEQQAPRPASNHLDTDENLHHMKGNREPGAKGGKERRGAAASEAVREELKKLQVGGPQDKDDKTVYEVPPSDDELEEEDGSPHSLDSAKKSEELREVIVRALAKTFIFEGLSKEFLEQVADKMFEVSFKSGQRILQQDAVPTESDCLYFLEQGEVEVVISGAVDSGAGKDENSTVSGNQKRIPMKPGWVFGDVSLLFNSPRSASVEAKTNCVLWAMDRKLFMKVVMRHAQGARMLRFLRKLPLLKGLSDNDLIKAGSRMHMKKVQHGEALIQYGERGDELYLIRYGKVKVLIPDGKGGRIEVALLGRGQFVGERSVINDRLRSADCVAEGNDTAVVVLRKNDFLALDNPLLALMLDYDAISAVLKHLPVFKGMKQDQMEHVIDRFDARREQFKGDTIIAQGSLIDKLYVLKLGEVKLFKDGQQIEDKNFVREAGNFGYFGHTSLHEITPSPYTVIVGSSTVHYLCLPRSQLDSILGPLTAGLTTTELVVGALKKNRTLAKLKDDQMKALLSCSEEVTYHKGEVIATAYGLSRGRVFLVKEGEVMLALPEVELQAEGIVDVNKLVQYSKGRLSPGALFNEKLLSQQSTGAMEASLVASGERTVVLSFNPADLQIGPSARPGSSFTEAGKRPKPKVRFQDLEMHRVVGTGQFGSVRIVRNRVTNEVYALKAMFKAPITESKQIEHIINERKILEEANHPFCVQMVAAYQDKNCLYLLQEWVAGGELFHHLDLVGAFDEPTAMFYAANVILAMEFLHNKGIVYRDLKPENLLLDTQGYIKMADFGFAKYIGSERTHTICGTPDYQAPEVIMRRGTNKGADYWAIGVLIFEMLVGDPPFKSLTGDPWDTFRRTLAGRFYVPQFISEPAADLIFKLLQVQPERRLGCGPGGADEIKKHRWFAGLDWDALAQRKLRAPIPIKVRNPLDTSNFDDFGAGDEPPPPPNPRNPPDSTWELWDWVDI